MYSSDTLGSGTINYTYDELNRLTKETLRDGTQIEYTYDAAGNRLTKKIGANTTNYSCNAANELTTVGGTSYTYDKNGNLLDDGTKLYEYDYNNRLTTVRNKSDNSVIATYTYDADGRRTSKTVGTAVTKYYYDGGSTRVFYETDGNGSLQVRYIYGDGDTPVAMVRGTTTYFFHYNGHGDVVALTDSTGTVVAEYDYDAFGNTVTTGREGSVINPYRYAGYRYDSETGLYYLNARYYAPSVGRFISRDKFDGIFSDPLSLNRYIYTGGNPVNYVDPEGEFFFMLAAAPYIYYLLAIGAIVLLAQVMINDNDKPWYSLPGSMKYGKYPSEYRDSTWKRIKSDAKKGLAKARTAKKIIEQGAKRIVEKVKNKGKGGKKK